MNREKLGATVGARLIFVSLRKTKNSRKKGSGKAMRTAFLVGQETYIPAEDHPSTPRDATLVKEVIAEAQKLVDSGHNAKIGCVNKTHQKEYEARQKKAPEGYVVNTCGGVEYDLACQIIREAQNIIKMGYNAKIGCSDAEPDKSEREKRKAYYKWKRMNR